MSVRYAPGFSIVWLSRPRHAPVTHQDQGVGGHRLDGLPRPWLVESPRKPLVPGRVQAMGRHHDGRQVHGYAQRRHQSLCGSRSGRTSFRSCRYRTRRWLAPSSNVLRVRDASHRQSERLCLSRGIGEGVPIRKRGSKPDPFPGSPLPALRSSAIQANALVTSNATSSLIMW